MAERSAPSIVLKVAVVVGIVIGGFFALGILGFLVGNYIVVPLIVGKGDEVEVPEVVGLPLEEAIVLLEEQGFESVADEKRPDTLYVEGTVLEQRPGAGSKIKKGRLVQLTVSSGEESVRVPYLLGLTLEQATAIAQRRNFQIEQVDTVQNDTVPPGRIVAMKPDPEIRVAQGTKLRLYISAGPIDKTIPVPNLIDLPLGRAQEMLEADSLVLKEVRRMEVAGKGGIVVLQSPEPGVFVGKGDTIRVTVGQEP
ncbi:MAG: PASTA domain-containing protein [Candidatus Stahlbacteria bacterium]|nr:MAG: PASTA domain-containing protein [Candidatus Stahlbacteria bacterium]